MNLLTQQFMPLMIFNLLTFAKYSGSHSRGVKTIVGAPGFDARDMHRITTIIAIYARRFTNLILISFVTITGEKAFYE